MSNSASTKFPQALGSNDSISAKAKFLNALSNLGDMSKVDNVIRSKQNSEVKMLEEISTYLFELGGKRMRPALTLLAAQALGMQTASQDLIEVAAGIELIHMATLLHDDIIDNSSLRRHQASPLIKFGQSETLLAGDFLLVRAFSLCSHLDRKIIDATEVACVHLTEGEILEIPLYAQTHSRASSLEIARKKTAALFKLAAFSAAYLADGSPEVSDNFSAFGESLGIAFQILDDILDVTSNEDLLGKPSGTDIRERKPALVNVLWLETSSERAKILLKKPTKNEDDFVRESVLELRASSVIDEARKIALGYTNAARQQLQSAMQKAKNPNFDVYAALESLIDYTIERVA